MEDSIEYQIFIGCNDSQLNDEVVNENELKEMLSEFFTRKKIGFSMLSAKGGFLHENGSFVTENTLCVSIIGGSDLDIVKFAKSLSMYMNQECSLIIRHSLKIGFR